MILITKWGDLYLGGNKWKSGNGELQSVLLGCRIVKEQQIHPSPLPRDPNPESKEEKMAQFEASTFASFTFRCQVVSKHLADLLDIKLPSPAWLTFCLAWLSPGF